MISGLFTGRRWGVTVLVSGLAAVVFACSGSSDGGAGDTAPAGDTAAPQDTGSGTGDVAAGGCPCSNLVGKGFRYTRLVAHEPDDPNVTTDDGLLEALSGNWEQDIGDGLLNLVMEVIAFDAGAGTATLRIGPAWPAEDGTYALLADRSVDVAVTVDAQCQFESVAASDLSMYSGPADEPQLCAPTLGHAIPIHDLRFEGRFIAECTQIREARMMGCLTAAESRDVCFCMMEGNNCPRNETGEPLYVAGQPNKNCKGCGGLPWVNQGYMVENALSDDYMANTFCPADSTVLGYRFGGLYEADVLSQYQSSVTP